MKKTLITSILVAAAVCGAGTAVADDFDKRLAALNAVIPYGGKGRPMSEAESKELKAAQEKAIKERVYVTNLYPGNIAIGMTETQVINSQWGRPKYKKTSTYQWGTYAQWVYESGNYLYFDNGILSSITTSR
jgi:hypothetical protein